MLLRVPRARNLKAAPHAPRLTTNPVPPRPPCSCTATCAWRASWAGCRRPRRWRLQNLPSSTRRCKWSGTSSSSGAYGGVCVWWSLSRGLAVGPLCSLQGSRGAAGSPAAGSTSVLIARQQRQAAHLDGALPPLLQPHPTLSRCGPTPRRTCAHTYPSPPHCPLTAAPAGRMPTTWRAGGGRIKTCAVGSRSTPWLKQKMAAGTGAATAASAGTTGERGRQPAKCSLVASCAVRWGGYRAG